MLDLWNFKKSVGAKTLYNMLFIFLFFYWFVIDYLVLVSVFILGCKDTEFWNLNQQKMKNEVQ